MLMKKTLLSLAVVLMSMAAVAQVLEVTGMQRLATPVTTDAKVAGIAPDGSYILLTSASNQGLTRFDLATAKATTITTAAGAGYNVRIAEGGRQIIFRETTVGKDHLRRHNMVRLNMDTRRRAVIARSLRDMSALKNDEAPLITINNCLMELTINGETRTLAPNGTDGSYIWPSISPDGTKICYYLAGNGCWVCNIDGSNPQYIAHDCRAAKWYNNDVIIAMADHDDGHFTTESAIVAYTLNGNKQVLTDNSMIAMYPYAIEGAVVFSTEAGETYIMNVK